MSTDHVDTSGVDTSGVDTSGVQTSDVDTAAVKTYLTGLQDRIVAELERLDGNRFQRDAWQREGESSGGLGGGVEVVGPR